MKLLLFLLVLASTTLAQTPKIKGIAITRAEFNRLNAELEQKYLNPNYEFTIDEILHFMRMYNSDYPEFFRAGKKLNPSYVNVDSKGNLLKMPKDKIAATRMQDSLNQRREFLDRRYIELPTSPLLGEYTETPSMRGWSFKKYNIHWFGTELGKGDLTNSRYIIID